MASLYGRLSGVAGWPIPSEKPEVSKETGMNYSTQIFLISPDVRPVMVEYDPDDPPHKHRLYKTLDPRVKKGCFVIVPTDTRHKMTVAKVVEVDVEFDPDTNITVEWILGIADTEDVEKLKTQEDQAIALIKKKNLAKRRRELRETMLAEVEDDDDFKALPFYSPPDGGSDKGDGSEG